MPPPHEQSHRRTRTVLLAALMTLALLAQLPAIAVAEHGGSEVGSLLACDRPVDPPRCTSVGDDRRHYVHFDASLTPALTDAMRTAMADAYSAPTKLSLIEQSKPTARTDVVAYSADYGDNGAAAWVYCPADAPQGINASGDRWCRQQELIFNLNPRYGLFFDDDASREHVACHELGHTLGLRHWGNPPQSDGPIGATCMTANTPDGSTRLHATDIDHIDAYAYALAPRVVPPPLPEAEQLDRVVSSPRVAGGLVGASEVERPATLEALADSADLVVHGRVADVAAGRVFGPEHHPLHYAAVTLEVVERIAGRTAGAPATVVVELPLLQGVEGLEALRADMLGTHRVVFLRSKAASAARAGLPLAEQLAERDFHRLVTFGSELVAVGGQALAAPDETRLLEPFSGRPFADVVAELREIAASR